MVLSNELRGRIVAKGLTQVEVAKLIGCTPKTLNTKLKTGVFKTDEVEILIQVLDIKDPLAVFFA